MKSKLFILSIIALFMFPMGAKAQGWMTFGSAIGNKLTQNSSNYVSSFSPEIELGLRLPLTKMFGFALSGNFRWIDTEKIEWFDERKFVWDVYVGPSFLIPFDDFDTMSGLMLKPSIGYSTSAAWFDPDINSGSFSMMLSADFVIHGFMIGGFWRPMKQHIEGKSSSSKYGQYMHFLDFESQPSFGIRIGYLFFDNLFD